jgi:hypothetical protein
VRRQDWSGAEILRVLVRSPQFGWAMLIGAVFVVCCSVVMWWTASEPLLAVGQPSRETVLARVPVEIVDESRTTFERENARRMSPRVYLPDERVIRGVVAVVRGLPGLVGSATDLSQISADDRRRFSIDERSFALLGSVRGPGGEPSEAWTASVVELEKQLRHRPVVDREGIDRQRESLATMAQLQLATGQVRVLSSGIVPLEDAEAFGAAAVEMSRASRFSPDVLPTVAAAITGLTEPTFRLDGGATARLEDTAAAAVAPAVTGAPGGAVIIRRGERASDTQIAMLRAESEQFFGTGPLTSIWLQRAGLTAVAVAITAGVIGYVGLYSPRIRRNPHRMAALAGLMFGGLLVSAVATVQMPEFRALTVLAPAVFVTTVLAIAYEGRMALAIGSLEALLIGVGLREPAPMLTPIVAGISVAAWQLSDLRDRRSLIRAGVTIGLVLSATYGGASLVSLPANAAPAWGAIAVNAAWAGVSGVLVMGLTLFILPVLERLFDITTGMTLIELRDPKQPLLRELQRRAPGTYNHSLNVAAIAEQAAEAIGADSLLTYAGVLYHDIGKMNKPEYFVENQTGGASKHDKLSPAMSLLVIVGHVKDGLELAREFGLPRPLHHFIEAHHGTTLVEYFYERARRQAEQQGLEGGSDEKPAEIEYRYPGPKPQTREAAIVMIADAVESATRTLSEPTPSRIDALVHAIARKRLEDGQFDECGLTLRDLHVIIESVSKSVTAIYHGRIAYPGSAAAR